MNFYFLPDKFIYLYIIQLCVVQNVDVAGGCDVNAEVVISLRKVVKQICKRLEKLWRDVIAYLAHDRHVVITTCIEPKGLSPTHFAHFAALINQPLLERGLSDSLFTVNQHDDVFVFINDAAETLQLRVSIHEFTIANQYLVVH